jgi:hypothetical protein
MKPDDKFGQPLEDVLKKLPPAPPWTPPSPVQAVVVDENPLAFLNAPDKPPPQPQPGSCEVEAAEKYQIHGKYFFDCGPGYWKAKNSFTTYLIIGVLLTVSGIFTVIGLGVLVALLMVFLIGRADWRNLELQRAMRDAHH